MNKEHQDGIKMGESGPGFHIETQLLLKVSTKVDLCGEKRGRYENYSMWTESGLTSVQPYCLTFDRNP